MTATALAFYRDAVLQTIGIACGALALALAAGVPLALTIVRGGIVGRCTAAGVAVVRAIPDLVLAIVAVVALGFGPAAGVIALGVHYAAVIAKLYAETLAGVRREGAEALRATGSTSLAAFLVGMLPIAWPGIVGFGVYAFESITRASVIVGVVGAGGIGSLLVQQLNFADYQGFVVSLCVLIVVVLLADAAGAWLRLRARPAAVGVAFAAVVITGIAAFVLTSDPPWATIAHAPRHLVAFITSALPPAFDANIARAALTGIAVTLGVSLAGTAGGALVALPLAWLASARTRASATLGGRLSLRASAAALLSRGALGIVRAAPPIALALIGLSLVGLGPPAAIFALVVHTAGVLGKLWAESLELAEPAPAQALAATGATAAAAAAIALIPTAAAALATHVLYRFEWNVRASTVLGMVGAGGLGQAIYNEQQLLHYPALMTYVLAAVVLVIAIDRLVARGRSQWYLASLAR